MSAPYDVILCGPISGTTDAKERFAMVKCDIRNRVFKATGKLLNIWNPAELDEGRTQEWYMRRCVTAIFDSPDCVLVRMAGWEHSKGGRAESALSESIMRLIMNADGCVAHYCALHDSQASRDGVSIISK